MLVKELMKKLEKCDPEAEIVVSNYHLFIDGIYKAKSIKKTDDYVYIKPDYDNLVAKIEDHVEGGF